MICNLFTESRFVRSTVSFSVSLNNFSVECAVLCVCVCVWCGVCVCVCVCVCGCVCVCFIVGSVVYIILIFSMCQFFHTFMSFTRKQQFRPLQSNERERERDRRRKSILESKER